MPPPVTALSTKVSTKTLASSRSLPIDDPHGEMALRKMRKIFEDEEFSINDIALHFLSLYFIRLSTNSVLYEVEALFAQHYATLQHKLHIRGIWAWVVFLSGTVLYDYLSLIKGYGNIFTTNTTSFSNPNAKTAFYITLVLRFAVIIPLLLVNLWSGYKAHYKAHMFWTWISHIALAIYPVAYNLLTFDFGVSWLCLVIMYFYSFTPIRFLHAAIFNALLLGTYAAFAYGGILSGAMIDTFQREWLWALLFYALISYPSQSREFAIRVSYMSETILLSQQDKLEQEEMRSKSLLGSMLPASVVSQLQAGRELIADEYASVTVLFCEVCDFNTISGQLDPDQVVELLNTIFSKFDMLVDYHSVHKIETIGAVYMVSGGCPDRMTNHATLIANLALDMIATMPDLRAHIRKTFKWAKNIGDVNIRIGINTGILMAGVVGIRNPRFKLFGDTVNVSSRMESTNLPGHIQLTETTYEAIKHEYVTVLRGTIPVKGRGEMQTYFLKGHQDGVPRQAKPVPIEEPASTTTKRERKEDGISRAEAVRESRPSLPDVSKRTLSAIGFGPSENEARTAFMRLLRYNNQSSSSVISQAPTKSILSESRFKQNTLLESTAVFYPQEAAVDSPLTPDGLMQLPPDMTKRNVFFYINTTNTLENMFRKENEKRWMRFFRASILLCILVKPVQTMYSSNALLNSRQFQAANILFIINICFTMPVCTCFLLFTFTDTFLRYRQLSSVCVLILISAFWNTELIAMQSRGYAYISTLVLYQCHFSMIAFVFRFMTTAIILGMYLLANIALSNSIIPGMTAGESARDTLMLCLRNAFYVVVFFVPQIWVVFTCEFKERINHFRDLVLSAQQVKLLDEQDRVAKLLRNLLPESIVHQLKSSPEVTIAEKFENVTILFTDMVNFTAYSSRVSAMELVQFLNDMYTRFDTISERRDLYKVEIIGDAYFVVGGCPLVTNNDAVTVLQAGLDMLNTLPVLRRNSSNPNLNIRIGVHSGRVVAGVVGIKDPRYHLFGETVAIAQSLESSGVPGRIHLSETTYTRVKNTDPNAFKFEYHKMLTIAGHNTKLRTYFVT